MYIITSGRKLGEVVSFSACAPARTTLDCSHKLACTPSSTRRTLRVNWYEDVCEFVRRKLSQTPEFAIAHRARNKIEALLSELGNQIRPRKVRLHGLQHAEEQFTLAVNRAERQSIDKVSESIETSGCRDGLKSHPPRRQHDETECAPRSLRRGGFFNSIVPLRA